MTKVLITGVRGMLGSALAATCPDEVTWAGVDLEDGDLTLPGTASALLAQHQPQTVLHCAAWTDVEGCTQDPARAMLHNGTATALMAEACTAQGARLVYVSTDYVFAGDVGRAYREDDVPRPLSAYGASKLAGERAVATVPNHAIVRTQWLYGPRGRNFVATIVKAARTRDSLRVVSDEHGSPTYTPDLAQALWAVARGDITGILHVTNSGVASWYDLAVTAVRTAGLTTPIFAIGSAEWGSPTRRPQYSPLDNQRWVAWGQPPLRSWEEAVAEYVHEYLADPVEED